MVQTASKARAFTSFPSRRHGSRHMQKTCAKKARARVCQKWRSPLFSGIMGDSYVFPFYAACFSGNFVFTNYTIKIDKKNFCFKENIHITQFLRNFFFRHLYLRPPLFHWPLSSGRYLWDLPGPLLWPVDPKDFLWWILRLTIQNWDEILAVVTLQIRPM